MDAWTSLGRGNKIEFMGGLKAGGDRNRGFRWWGVPGETTGIGAF